MARFRGTAPPRGRITLPRHMQGEINSGMEARVGPGKRARSNGPVVSSTSQHQSTPNGSTTHELLGVRGILGFLLGWGMKITSTPIPGLSVLELSPFADNRGSFARLFCARELSEIVAPRCIVQINLSRTSAVGAVRGLHYQTAPHAEMKL